MRRQPVLRRLHELIAVILAPLEDDIRCQPVLMPLQREEAGDILRHGSSRKAGDEIQHQIVPGHRRAGSDELLASSGNDQDAFRMDRHLRKGRRERLRIAEMHRRIHAVEEPGLGKRKDAGTGGAEQGALAVHCQRPFDEIGMPAGLPSALRQQDRRHDDDVRLGDFRISAMNGDRNAGGELQRTRPRSHDLDGEGPVGRVQQGRTVKHVEDARKSRDRCFGYGNETYMNRRCALRFGRSLHPGTLCFVKISST